MTDNVNWDNLREALEIFIVHYIKKPPREIVVLQNDCLIDAAALISKAQRSDKEPIDSLPDYIEWFRRYSGRLGIELSGKHTLYGADVIRQFIRHNDNVLKTLGIKLTKAKYQATVKHKVQSRNTKYRRATVRRAVRDKIITLCYKQCFYCGGNGTKTKGPDGGPWHIDHVFPVSRGGDNREENLILACRTCNIKKHDKTIEEILLMEQSFAFH